MASSDNPAPLVVEGAPASGGDPMATLQETLRQAVEKSLAESRAAYTRVKEAADETTYALETSVANASKGVIDLNTQALDALRANFDAGIDFAKAAINSKSVSDLVSLHSDHASKQVEVLAAQAKAFGDLAQKIAADTVGPIRTHVAKTFRLSA
jgi:phasin